MFWRQMMLDAKYAITVIANKFFTILYRCLALLAFR